MQPGCLLRLLLSLACCLLATASGRPEAFQHNPVILIPGNGGNQLWARLQGTASPWYCQKSTGQGAQQLWLRMSTLLYPAVKCLAYNLMLRRPEAVDVFSIFNGPEEVITRDNFGVETFVPGFGTVDTMLWIADWHLKYTAYFSTLVQRLVARHGFLRNATIRGAPYDFRKAPNEFENYFRQLKDLIEDTFEISGGRRAVLVAHSMGGKLTLHFLHAMTQAWKTKYIKHFVAVGGAFGGVPASLLAVLSGYGLGIPIVKPLWFRAVQRSWPSTHYLMPDPAVYPPHRPLVTAPSGEVYTLANLTDLFARAGYHQGSADFTRFAGLTDVTRPPGVPTTCVFGSGRPTPGGLRWSAPVGNDRAGQSAFPDSQPSSYAWDSGDETVAVDTAVVCQRWAHEQTLPVRVVMLDGAQHMMMLSDERFVSLVAGVATSTDD